MHTWNLSENDELNFEKHTEDVVEMLNDGAKRASVIAKKTMQEVRSAIGLL